MDKAQQAQKWQRAGRKPYPIAGKPVLVEVDGEVREGHYNEQRGMWFCGVRPIYPSHWRAMPSLPKGWSKGVLT
jgi:hypothetical protein